ncbi:hypothetical protein PF005_g5537 [Phytophthora fragariae]|uniref:Uncharacterized protein n=1 Tax=Phytophthora fragariae TaxID=53985 RepID=A0A6A3IDC9_9STRA|nr:hypothetical protein PF003_g13958 [Phytophthora fragariae]KAE8934817.1 hypothetical protein PF009_g15213 [Phytophthora fragariae]KAE8981046.1 hypothetical protein PF011_g22191 [Phytophthora fragariae]KAE9084789.1 hypothetical protein PF007_g21386 [Phytophthora fragariae]KAE9106552.1 hypothetical protein PF006_g21343 [Phytophthora fragariae]
MVLNSIEEGFIVLLGKSMRQPVEDDADFVDVVTTKRPTESPADADPAAEAELALSTTARAATQSAIAEATELLRRTTSNLRARGRMYRRMIKLTYLELRSVNQAGS